MAYTDINRLRNAITAPNLTTRARDRIVVDSNLQSTNVYFQLVITPEGGDVTPSVLTPGMIYILSVYASRVPTNDKSFPLQYRDQAVPLKLRVNSPDIKLESEDLVWSPSQPGSIVHRSVVRVLSQHDVTGLQFVLGKQALDNEDHIGGRIAELTISDEGESCAPSKPWLEKAYINPAQTIPDNVAVLHVTRIPDSSWQFEGWNRRTKGLARAQTKQAIDLTAEWLERACSENSIDIVWHRFKEWSSLTLFKNGHTFDNQPGNTSTNLYSWLKVLMNCYEERLVLVIVAQDDPDFPWELIHIQHPKTGEEMPLGAYASLVHWMNIDYYDEHIYLDIGSVVTAACRGSVAAYVDKKLEGSKDEEIALSNVQATNYESLTSLLQALKDSLTGTALIYAGCHGEYPSEFRHSGDEYGVLSDVGLYSSPGERISATDLMVMRRIALRDRPLVFLNACHSARTVRRNGEPVSMVGTLLQRIARGVIGTLTTVDSVEASRLAVGFLNKAAVSANGIDVARCLRDIRYDAFVRWSARPVQNSKDVYPFFYVYYGDPFLRLHLERTLVLVGGDSDGCPT